LTNCIKYHHRPSQYTSGEFIKAVKAIYVANQLCKLQGVGWECGGVSPAELEAVCREVGLSGEAKARVSENLKAEVDEAKEFFGITVAA
jgi:hypothetical protein